MPFREMNKKLMLLLLCYANDKDLFLHYIIRYVSIDFEKKTELAFNELPV